MTKRLKHVSPLQLGIVGGIFYTLLSLIFVPFILLAAVIGALAPHASDSGGAAAAGLGVGMAIVMAIAFPIMYGVMGFIIGALGGLIYNFVAKMTGGIQYISEPV